MCIYLYIHACLLSTAYLNFDINNYTTSIKSINNLHEISI